MGIQANPTNITIDGWQVISLNLTSVFHREQAPVVPPEMQRRKELIAQLNEVKYDLERNEQLYNLNIDFDMVDFYIHERNALFVRYDYLIKQVRSIDAELRAKAAANPAPAQEIPTAGFSSSAPEETVRAQ